MDGADPPIPSPPSPSFFNHPTRLQTPEPELSHSPPLPLRIPPSAPKEDGETKPPPPSLPYHREIRPSEVTMSTRKRPRNNNGSTSTPASSAGRSGGGGSTTSSSSSSSAMRRTTSLSDLAPPPEIPGRPQTRAARGDAVVAGAGTVRVGAEMMRRHSGDFLPAMETAAFLKACGLCKRRLGPGRDTFIYMCVSKSLCFFLARICICRLCQCFCCWSNLSACRSAACSFPLQDCCSATAF